MIDDAKTWVESMSPEEREVILRLGKALGLVPAKTVRDVPTPDIRIYYHIRLGQFECVVDERDVVSGRTPYDCAICSTWQPWYFIVGSKDEPVPLTTKWSHTQYVEWLRRSY